PDRFGFAVGRFATNNAIWATPIGPTAEQPVLGKSAEVDVVSGTVLVQAPGSKRFVPLVGGDVVPVGSVIDTTKGRVRIRTALPSGSVQSSDFFEGVFKLTQAKTGLTDLALTGGSFRSCPRASRSTIAKAKVIRHLWGAGSGLFRTKGRYASAS